MPLPLSASLNIVPTPHVTNLQDAINNLPPGGGEIILQPNYIYIVNTLILPTKDNISITGHGIDSTIIDFGSSTQGQLFFNGRNNIILRNLTLRSANGIAKDRLLFNNSNGITLDNIKIEGGGKFFSNWAVFFNTNNRNIVLNNITTINSQDTPVRFYSQSGLYNADIRITGYTNNGNSGSYQYGNGDGLDLFGAQNVYIDNFHAKNMTGNGLGIYANAKNIVANNITVNNIGGNVNMHNGHGVGILRWSDMDPANIQLYNVNASQCWGHGIQLYNKLCAPCNNSSIGNVKDVTITNYTADNIWWSGLAIESGNASNILLEGFKISNTNVSKGGSPVIFLDSSSYNNVAVQNGEFVLPFIQSKIFPPGVTMKNIKNFII